MSKIETSKQAREALVKVEKMQTELAPLLHQRLSFQVDEGLALFLGLDGEFHEISFVPVSSYGVRSKTLKWAWANEVFSLPTSYNHSAFLELSRKTGFEIFQSSEPKVVNQEENRCLHALVAEHFNALGLLSEQHNDTYWSFLITEIRSNLEAATLSPEEVSLGLYDLLNQNKVDLFNRLREKHPAVKLDFTDADLRGKKQAWKGDLHGQVLFDNNYSKEHSQRVLDGINLSGCRLDGSNFQGVSLKNASFTSSVMIDADFSRADLTNADLEQTFLSGTNFSGTLLKGVNFKQAEMGRTLFVDTDLSECRGLDATLHLTSSEISFSTLIKSGFKVSEQFMRSCGVSIGLIEDLRRGKRFGTTYSTCFLSYSSQDRDFAQKIYYALMNAGVRVYWDSKNLLGGMYLDEQLIAAIKEHDRTITVLSENSLRSKWVLKEVQAALYYKREGFTPIRLCDIKPIQSFVKKNDIRPDIVDSFPIPDFSNWSNKEAFEEVMSKLLQSIRR